MGTALFDSGAFVAVSSLLSRDLHYVGELEDIDEFFRLVLLHDDIVQLASPLSYSTWLQLDGGQLESLPALGYDLSDSFDYVRDPHPNEEDQDIELSPQLVAGAAEAAGASEGNAAFI